MFSEQLSGSEQCRAFERRLIGVLWNRREPDTPVRQWLTELRAELLDAFFEGSRSQDDERAILTAFQRRVAVDGDHPDMTLGQFGGRGEGSDHITLSTLHSSKGREFAVVVLFGIDGGRLPRRGASASAHAEARRTFYVGFTRAKQEVHMMFSRDNASPFVREVQQRLEE
jgi:superfamily I DNA/RNA helicase